MSASKDVRGFNRYKIGTLNLLFKQRKLKAEFLKRGLCFTEQKLQLFSRCETNSKAK